MSMADIFRKLRQAIRASGRSRYSLWKESGVDQAALSRFMRGQRGLSVEAVERLADSLGLEVTIRPKRGRKGR